MADADADRYSVPALERGLRLLQEFSRREPVLGAPELARRLGLPRSTVFRMLVTLENLGFVERTADGRAHRLGVGVLRLGFECLAGLDIIELGRPILERLRDATGFTANLVVRDGRDVVYVHRAPSPSPFATTVSVGTRLPAHATVLGHVLLGDLSPAELRAVYPESRLPVGGAATPTTVEALHELVAQTRARGHALAEGFFEPHISTVAAPVRGENDTVVAAIGLTIPGASIPPPQRPALVAAVRGAAAQLSVLMNYHDDHGAANDAVADDGVAARR